MGVRLSLYFPNTRLRRSFFFNNHGASLVFSPFECLPFNKFSDRLLKVSKNMNIIVSQYRLLSVMQVEQILELPSSPLTILGGCRLSRKSRSFEVGQM